MEQEYKYMVATRCFTFNHAPYIEDAMNGFVMQETTFPVVTLIVDDASADGEPEVIRKYLAEHFHSPYRTEETEYAHIICAKHKTNANCDFVVFLLKYNHYSIKKPKLPYLTEWTDNAKYHALCEGDDYWTDPLKLQKQVDIMEQNPDLSLCFCDVTNLNESTGKGGDRQGEVYEKSHLKLPTDPKRLFYWIIMGKCRLQTLSVLYKNERDVIPQNANFLMGDTPKWIRYSQKGSFYYINEVCGVYRIHEGSVSHSSSNKVRFQLSMSEMRVFYCEYYNYPVPKMVKQGYNRSLCRYRKLNGEDAYVRYPLFKMNVLQRFVAQKMIRGAGWANKLAGFCWSIEVKISNLRLHYNLFTELR